MIHYGDITKISGYDVPIVDCVTFGAPCQDLSVAGRREGMKHKDMGDDETTRSGLFHEAIRIIKEMRENDKRVNGRSGESIRPRFAIYENVPGAFSSNKGKDFKIVLESLAKIAQEDAVIPMPPKDKWTTSGAIVGDGWSIAWRVLDAQFWGVPQRRRRIALVADFGGRCAQEVLFERKSLRGDSSESRTERKGSSADAQGCIGMYDRTRECISLMSVAYSIENHPSDSRVNIDASGKVKTLTSRMGTGGGNVPMVMGAQSNSATDSDHIPCVVMDRASYNQGINAKYDIGIDEDGKAFSHIAKGPGAIAYCIGNGQVNDAVSPDKELCKTLNCMVDPMKVLIYNKPHYIVRRLTPLECERLQGFTDGWTDIGEYIDSKGKKKKTSDSARYKALGNSIALPPWKWVLKRISAQYERDATLASLFDGIGGFPCLWEQINGKGSCLWASEIEDFPIATTKKRIG